MPVRWNSTYEFLSTALKMKVSLQKLMIVDEDLCVYQIESSGWERIKLVAEFLKEFVEVTQFMSQSCCSTFSHSYPLYNLLIDKVEAFIQKHPNNAVLFNASNASLKKLKDYYSATDESTMYMPAIGNCIFFIEVLNPCYKFQIFHKLGFTNEEIAAYKEEFKQLFIVMRNFHIFRNMLWNI